MLPALSYIETIQSRQAAGAATLSAADSDGAAPKRKHGAAMPAHQHLVAGAAGGHVAASHQQPGTATQPAYLAPPVSRPGAYRSPEF